MKLSFPLVISLILIAGTAFGQTTKTIGPLGNYTTLKAAFDDINSVTVTGGVSGAITLQITGSTIETSSAVLNAKGIVTTIAVTNGGSGYITNPTVTITGGGVVGATATATRTGNVVTAITVTNHGSGYTAVPTVSITGGSGSGAAAVASVNLNNYSSVLIYPTGTGYSVSGNLASPLIALNGADNVTIDGRVNQTGSTNSLVISNSSLANNATTVRLYNSACSNAFRYCNLSGSASSTAVGIISLSTAGTGSGNDSNTIEYCNITNAGGNRAVNVILSSGSNGSENSENLINNNNIYNFINPLLSSNGINLSAGSFNNTISGNSFYETAVVTPVPGVNIYNVIKLGTGEGNLISGNYIGGSAPLCGGSAMTVNANTVHYFCGIVCNSPANTTNTIQNNVIKNISYTSIQSNPWDGINIKSGNLNITGNTIGATTGNNSIVVTTPSAAATSVLTGGAVTQVNIIGGGSGYSTPPVVSFGANSGGTTATATAILTGGVVTSINITNGGSGYASAPAVVFDGQTNGYSTSHGMIQGGPGTVSITNNTIGSITSVGSNYYSQGIESIYVSGTFATTTISNNLIGSLTTPNSIYASSTAALALQKQDVYGLYSGGSGTTILSGNTVANLSNGYTGLFGASRARGICTTAGSNSIVNNTVRDITSYSKQSSGGSAASVIGIAQLSAVAATTQSVIGNTISNLFNSSPTASVSVTGLFYSGLTTGTHVVSRNFVHSLNISSNDTTSTIKGIEVNAGSVTCSNNIVTLGVTVNRGYKINGIWDESSIAQNIKNFFFNTVYIGGNVTTSAKTLTTAAFWSQGNASTRDYRNNILVNARSGGATGKHYAISLSGKTSLTIDNNDYTASGTGGVLGFLTLDKLTLAAFQAATGQDVNSKNVTPGYSVPGGTSALNYYTSASLPGVTGTGITIDYTGAGRNAAPKMGALEKNLFTWKGTVSDNFNTASNWLENEVPASEANIAFDANPVNHCVLDQNRTVGTITNAQNAYHLVVNGKQLTLAKDLDFTNGATIDASAVSSEVVFAGAAAQSIPAATFFKNQVYSLTVNNSKNVTLNGTMILLNTLTATTGLLDAYTNSPSVTYAGSNVQKIENSILLDNRVFNLTIDNVSGVELNTDLTITNNLTINSGRLLTVAAAKQLSVAGILANNSDESGLQLKSDASGTASLMHNSNNVKATLERFISGSANLTDKQYHLVSVPVNSADYKSSTWMDSFLFTYDEVGNYWKAWDSPTGNTLLTNSGAMIYYPGVSKTYVITGQLNNGAYSPLMAFSGSGKGFNLVPNPYPSSIDWNSNVDYWTRTNIGSTVWGFDPVSKNYGTWNSVSGSTNHVTNIIPVGQSFFVQATGNSPVLTMTNAVRLHDSKAFLKSGTAVSNSLHLIASGNAGQDEMAVVFTGNATNYSDDSFDAAKFYGSMEVPQLSSFMDEDASLLSINVLPFGENTTIVPLHFDMNYTGAITFTATGFESFAEGQPVKLEDRKLNKVVDLVANPVYTFTHQPTDDAARFRLHFAGVTGIDDQAAEVSGRVYLAANELYVSYKPDSRSKSKAVVYNMLGQVISEYALSGSGEDKFTLNAITGVYLVKLWLPAGAETFKIVVR